MLIEGDCAPGFAVVREAFAANFAAGREVGASFAATRDGAMIVDLWGGHADAARERPWQRDTIVNVFSTTKAMTALCAHILVERGQLDVDSPVARYWPEFGACGKQAITRLLGPATLARAIEVQSYTRDLVLGLRMRWGLGFMLASDELPLSPNRRTFGHGGWGGSLGFADLEARVSWAYVMNKMSPGTTGDSRAAGPVAALYGAL